MSDDLLQRATKALREQGGKEPSAERSALVRARLLSQTKRRAQLRPQGIWQWAAVVCLGFFVSTAMAHVIKVQLPRVIEALRERPTSPPKAAHKRVRPVQPQVAVPQAPAPAPEPEPTATHEAAQPDAPEPPVVDAAPSVPARPPAPARKDRPAKTPPRPAPKPPVPAPTALAAVSPEQEPPPPTPTAQPPEAAPGKPQAAESAELALFRRAQSLHLSKNPKAIEAWDAYLRVAGTSALAPEARYNRALGLVRAGRYREAKAALAPFAEGRYGNYRRAEAQTLLSRMPK